MRLLWAFRRKMKRDHANLRRGYLREPCYVEKQACSRRYLVLVAELR